MGDKLLGLIEERNSLVPSSERLTIEEIRNRDSWFWSAELQELDETGLNESIRSYIDYDQKSKRIEEEEALIEEEGRNFNRNVNEILEQVQDSVVGADSSRLSYALRAYKKEIIEMLNSWIIT
jgi:hypothetical protein